MMTLKEYKFLVILFVSSLIYSQNQVSGYIIDSVDNLPLNNVKIINSNGNILTITDENGYYDYSTSHDSLKLTFLKIGLRKNSKVKHTWLHQAISISRPDSILPAYQTTVSQL